MHRCVCCVVSPAAPPWLLRGEANEPYDVPHAGTLTSIRLKDNTESGRMAYDDDGDEEESPYVTEGNAA